MLRTNEYSYLLENEVNTLRVLEESYPDINGIPKIPFSNNNSGTLTVRETYIGGTQISKVVTRKNYRDLALKATSWLVKLSMATKTVDTLNSNLAKTTLSDITSSLGTALDKKLIQDTNYIIYKLKLPYAVCEHGDFATQNVLIDSKGNLGVIDWEDSCLYCLPASDLIFFHILLNLHLEDAWKTGKFREAYRNILDRTTFAGSIFDECITAYMTELGIALEETQALRLTTLLAWLHIHLNDLISIANPEKIRNSLFVGLWEEELRLYHRTHISS